MLLSSDLQNRLRFLLDKKPSKTALNFVQKGYDAFIVAQLSRLCADYAQSPALLYALSDENRMNEVYRALQFFAPAIKTIRFPNWDCQPYDRAAPNQFVMSTRLQALDEIEKSKSRSDSPFIVLTSANAIVQRVVPQTYRASSGLELRCNSKCAFTEIGQKLIDMGYKQTSLVYSDGYFSIRGGIIDVFPFFNDYPVRIDFFGDIIDKIRIFNPESQRTTGEIPTVNITPASEVFFNEESRQRFIRNYLKHFGVAAKKDPLYQEISDKSYARGLEHWLPLFVNDMSSVINSISPFALLTDFQLHLALQSRFALIEDNYQSRKIEAEKNSKTGSDANIYRPLAPDSLYLGKEELQKELDQQMLIEFCLTDGQYHNNAEINDDRNSIIDCRTSSGRNFVSERKISKNSLTELINDEITTQISLGKKVFVTAHNTRLQERIAEMIKNGDAEGNLPQNVICAQNEGFDRLMADKNHRIVIVDADFAHGFVAPQFILISDQDIFGEHKNTSKNIRPKKNQIQNLYSLLPGDYIVHAKHGIGQFQSLITLEIDRQPHECLAITYQNNDRLYLPIEDLDLISRYGKYASEVALDRLGSAAFQQKRARLKRNLLEMAEKIIALASKRQAANATVFTIDQQEYSDFCDGFIHAETASQLEVASEVIADMSSGTLMDRLVCGDAGFGKTEIAMRAAFAAISNGYQAAVLVPTTLLARQHSQNFRQRFANQPAVIRELSRMVKAKQAKITKEQLEQGFVDIVIGTHALLANRIKFKKLGLIIVDEEQHFGVNHKEKLKNIASNIHVLSLSATPIPRTLHMAFSGLKSLSFVSSPPIDRQAIRSFVIPFDNLTLRHALLREHYRGGQSFFIAPRIADLNDIKDFLDKKIPELTYAIAHGKMNPAQLDATMNDFYDGKFDVLVATTIVESGLDISNANTMIIHKANMFGMSQLYQLRGRVGRSSKRGYAYFTTLPNIALGKDTLKRLEVLQTIEIIGAGFHIASRDYDIRGGGNLLGDRQSGHIKEVGLELYQQMLQEALSATKKGEENIMQTKDWTPEIFLGVPVQIPKTYIPDIDLRIDVYRRLVKIDNKNDFIHFAEEMENRFGKLPEQFKIVFEVCQIKFLCKKLNIERVQSGAKGVTIKFYQNYFEQSEKLIKLINENAKYLKLRSDHRLLIMQRWKNHDQKLQGLKNWLVKMQKHCAII